MEEIVLCAASAYEKKFYLNEEFSGLPQSVKDELKIMCALFTEDVGGILAELLGRTNVARSRSRSRGTNTQYVHG